jgi:hypothetical protein
VDPASNMPAARPTANRPVAIESKWSEKPVGHANYFGVKRAARHTKWCTVLAQEVFTLALLTPIAQI